MSAQLAAPTEHPCGSTICDAEAVVRVYWPGKAIDMCVACAENAAVIAKALGFALSVAPLGLHLVPEGKA